MKDPHHPAGPAFEQARETGEDRRQRLIAALTPQQREGFDHLRQQQEIGANELRANQQRQWRDQVAERMRGHLLQDKELHYKPDAHRHNLKDRQELSFAMQDFVAGRETRATRQYQHQLRQAHGKAENEVFREHRQARDKLRDTQQRGRDDFVKQAERERQRISPEFEKAARDPSWHRAFNRAAQKEADHNRGNPHDHKHDLDKTR